MVCAVCLYILVKLKKINTFGSTDWLAQYDAQNIPDPCFLYVNQTTNKIAMCIFY